MGISPEQWERVKALYEAALERDPDQRSEYLRQNTADEVVREEVRRLLVEQQTIGSFLSNPPFANLTIAEPQPEMRFATNEILAERFRVKEFIAAGGMGEVYEAEDLVLKESLAIKTIRPEVLQQNNALQRFKREVQLARKVTHPNICRVFDLFWHKRVKEEKEQTIFFVSMELLKGETLSERLRRSGRFCAQEALPLINQIASGIDAAHAAGVVHRDLKPGNVILVSNTDHNRNRCVITDFGLALRTGVDADKSTDLTASRAVFGTPAYMAPEQIEGKEVTKQADIYAFGLIIYEMVTGEHAYPADTPLASAAKRLSDPLVSPKKYAPELNDNWEQTIIRCLQRDPIARFDAALDAAKSISEQSAIQVSVPSGRGLVRPSHSMWNKFRASQKVSFLALSTFLFMCLALTATYLMSRKPSPGVVLTRPPEHRQITFLGTAVVPAISPDGTLVAYVTEAGPGSMKLMLQDVSSGQSTELLRAFQLRPPMWSSDGSEVVIGRFVGHKGRSTEDTAIVSRLGGSPRILALDHDPFCTLPGSLRIVAGNSNPDAGIWIVDGQTGSKQEISKPAYHFLNSVTCSQKTGTIVLVVATDGKNQIWTMKPDGSQQRKMLESKEGIESATMSPNEDAIYYFYSRAAGESKDLVKLPLAGTGQDPVVLVSGLEAGDSFTLSKDGRQLAYTRGLQFSNLWLSDLRGIETSSGIPDKALTSGTIGHDFPSFSPDGHWVAFSMGAGPKSNVYKMPIGGGEAIQLTFFDAAEALSPAWSQDGTKIAFVSNQGGTFRVWIVSSNGGTPREYSKTNASSTNYGLAWFPSKEVIYQKPELHNLLRLNPETENEVQILPRDSDGWLVSRPKISPDGTTLAVLWNRKPQQGLWLFNRLTHSERLLAPEPYWCAGWSPDGKYVYAGTWGERKIIKIDVESGKQTDTKIVVHGSLRAATVSPDGKKIIIGVDEQKSDVWLMKNFDPVTIGAEQRNR